MGLMGCTKTLVTNYKSTLRNIPEERRFHLHHGRILKSAQMLYSNQAFKTPK
jgi:hypothetical protein